ncbi:patatin-like phospholipase family protein [uncultured Alsobacter sp.]|uniref:patatin-like phospholipase family protein n=1 Tax=uncultured Alsobacter sp. TaxID=1748258 RepID=UPI0025FAC276|nr:patatin-like phospholipase family protein [uncultured Alsobacter sp.]
MSADQRERSEKRRPGKTPRSPDRLLPTRDKPVDNPGRPPFEAVALVLQGGGALGAYQCGVFEALAERDVTPDWVAGISIGAINCALIAGNPPEHRVQRLRDFWSTITENPFVDLLSPLFKDTGDQARVGLNNLSASAALASGANGFFRPRMPPPWLAPVGSPGALSHYSTDALRETLLKLVDFDRINDGPMRLSVGAVNIQSGNFVYFDTTTHRIGPEHIMASGALPPGFPPVEIDGQHYWDGGLISNTPLQWVVSDSGARLDTLAFQVDLWNARGDLPRDLNEVAVRQKEIQFSSRTRANTTNFERMQRLRVALAELLDGLPENLRDGAAARLLRDEADPKVYNIVHLIYRSQRYEGHAKDYEFSRVSMDEHWHAGLTDARKTLRHRAIYERPTDADGVAIYDVCRDWPDG